MTFLISVPLIRLSRIGQIAKAFPNLSAVVIVINELILSSQPFTPTQLIHADSIRCIDTRLITSVYYIGVTCSLITTGGIVCRVIVRFANHNPSLTLNLTESIVDQVS